MVLKQNFSCDTEDCMYFNVQEEDCVKGSITIQDGCCCDYEKRQDDNLKSFKVLGSMSKESIRLSTHIKWEQLQEIACNRLTTLMGREIEASADRWDYYHWGFNIAGSPLSKEEIDKLFLAVGADDFDHDSNDFGEYPIKEINQGLAEKLLAEELNFVVSSTHADDNGIWFFGPPEDEQVNILVYYPESDLTADCFRFTLKDGISGDDLISCFYDAMGKLSDNDDDDEGCDRLTRIDNIIAYVMEKTGCKAYGLTISCEAEII